MSLFLQPLDLTRFHPLTHCGICNSTSLIPYHSLRIDLSIYIDQDPELSKYSNIELHLCRCSICGFGQPQALPTIPNYFDRMYDQRWSHEWIENEFTSGYKDAIFNATWRDLEKLLPHNSRSHLDIGTHVGRFPFLGKQRGWNSEGIELNPRTRAFAQKTTGLPIHHLNAQNLVNQGKTYDAVSLIDVLEHIPDPIPTLRMASDLLRPSGIVVVKVPNGRMQHLKEEFRRKVQPSYRPSLADNLVHVNHFTPHSLTLALQKAGFTEVKVKQGVPEEYPPIIGLRNILRNRSRPSFIYYFLMQCLPSVWGAPAYLHMQAYARK